MRLTTHMSVQGHSLLLESGRAIKELTGTVETGDVQRTTKGFNGRRRTKRTPASNVSQVHGGMLLVQFQHSHNLRAK